MTGTAVIAIKAGSCQKNLTPGPRNLPSANSYSSLRLLLLPDIDASTRSASCCHAFHSRCLPRQYFMLWQCSCWAEPPKEIGYRCALAAWWWWLPSIDGASGGQNYKQSLRMEGIWFLFYFSRVGVPVLDLLENPNKNLSEEDTYGK